jgi:hypothetical protein
MTPLHLQQAREDAKRLERIKRQLSQSTDIEYVRAEALALINDRIKVPARVLRGDKTIGERV